MPERYLGQTLGKYRIDAVIGSGGFAWVYKAFDPELEIPVALKILKPQYAGDEAFEQRFRREASTAAKLRHPNIINIFAVGKEQGAVYFAMDYLPQGLADRLSVMTTLPESMLIRMAIDVGSALGFAHREGVIHRDIKTDNILFDDHGNAVVADFGIARAVAGYAEQTGTNMVMGTPQYFAPEQARGLQLDGRADIYSLGVTLFKAATGTLPFNGEDWYEIARQHVEERPPRPRSLNASITPELEDVILRMLEKDPENRYPSGEALCEDLAGILHERGESAAVRTVMVPATATLPPGTSAPRYRRRRRPVSPMTWVFASVAGILVLAIALSVGGGDGQSARAVQPGSGTNPITSVLGDLNSGARTKPTLTVRLPRESRGAAVTLAGADDTIAVRVDTATGTWATDTLRPGIYRLTASVPGRANCPTATVSKEVTVTAGQILVGDTPTSLAELFPRNCVMLTITARYQGRPGQVTYTLTGLDFTRTRPLPQTNQIREIVPIGQVTVLIRSQYCTVFSATPTVLRDTAFTVTPLCGVGG